MYFRTTLSLIVLATLSLGLDAQVQFGAETTLATVAGIDSVDSQSADLNGDGLLDVVVLNQDLGISPQWISVFPADGTGDLGPRVDIPFSLNLRLSFSWWSWSASSRRSKSFNATSVIFCTKSIMSMLMPMS